MGKESSSNSNYLHVDTLVQESSVHDEPLEELDIEIDITFIPTILDPDISSKIKEKAFAKALYYLAKQTLYSVELARKLAKAEFPQDITQATIEECQKKGWLNDEAYIQAFIQKHARRGKSALQIRGLAANKGIRSVILEPYLRDLKGSLNKVALSLLIAKKYKILLESRGSQACPSLKQKAYGALLRRGFAFQDIQAAITLLLEGESE